MCQGGDHATRLFWGVAGGSPQCFPGVGRRHHVYTCLFHFAMVGLALYSPLAIAFDSNMYICILCLYSLGLSFSLTASHYHVCWTACGGAWDGHVSSQCPRSRFLFPCPCTVVPCLRFYVCVFVQFVVFRKGGEHATHVQQWGCGRRFTNVLLRGGHSAQTCKTCSYHWLS